MPAEPAGAFKSLSILKMTALSLVIVMAVQDAVWAYPDMARPAAPASAARPVAIPQNMGRIEDAYGSDASTPENPLLINIRDAHRKLDSQYSISRLLSHLADNYQLGFIAVEGASGPVHTGLLTAFPDRVSRDRMAEDLMRKGRLSASEYFAVTSGRDVKLYGAENNGLYGRNRRLFGRILQLSTAARSMNRRMEVRYDREASGVLTPDALEFRSVVSDFRRRRIPLDVFVERIGAIAERAGGSGLFGRHSHASRYLRLLKTERRLDFERVDAERKSLLRTLRSEHSALTPNLARLSADYASKKMSHAEFFRALWRIARSRGVETGAYPALRLYLRYWAEFGHLDLYGVWSDLEKAEGELRRLLSVSPEAEDFFKRDTERILVSKLVTLGLSADEYRTLRRGPGLRISRHAIRSSERRAVRSALAFYAVAERRNRHILSNTLSKMKRDGIRTAALVTGGFHSEGLSELMRSDRVSHLIVMPSFDPATGDRPYVTVLTQRPAEWEKRLAGEDLYLAAPAWIGRAPATIAQAEPLLAELLAGRRAQGRADFTAEDIRAYEAGYRALHAADPDANPLRPEDLRRVLERVRNVRRVAPDRMQVTIGSAIWDVTVDASGQPVASALAPERVADAAVPGPSPVTTALVELETPLRRTSPSGPKTSAFAAVVPVRPAMPAVRREFKTVEDPDVSAWQGAGPADRTPARGVAAARLSVPPASIIEGVSIILSVAIPGFGWVLPAWMGLRGLNLAAFLLHNSGHKVAEMLVRPEAARVVSVREGVSWNRLLLSLLPFMPLPQEMAAPVTLGRGETPAPSERWIASGGQLASAFGAAVGAIALSWADAAGTAENWRTAAWTVWTALSVLTAASVPDWRTLLGRANAIACGPGFAILWTWIGSTSIFNDRMQDIMRILMKFSSRRGGQSGGASIKAQMNNNPIIQLNKLVKGKRHSITNVLLGSVYAFAKKMERKGYKSLPGIMMALFHLRYATGGRTNWDNTQPLWHRRPQWVMRFGVVKDRGPATVRAQATVAFTTVGHNGDMDAVDQEDGKRIVELESVDLELNSGGFFRGRTLTQGEARVFFKTAMPDDSSKATSDSKTIAEWYDFHMTQGILSRSLLQAWYLSVADTDAILEGTFRLPDPAQWERWEHALFDETANLIGRKDALLPGSFSLGGATPETRRRFRTLLSDHLGDRIPADAMDHFLPLAERAFFDQGLEWCVSRAASTFRGTFAKMVSSTLEPRIGILSLTQSFSFGVNETRQEFIGSAEPMGVTAVLGSGDPDDTTRQVMLKHGQFAVIEASADVPVSQAVRIYNAHTAYHSGTWHAPVQVQNKWFKATGNSKIKIPVMDNITQDAEDETGQALRDIPVVVEANRASFLPGGENAPVLAHLRGLIRRLARDTPPGAHIILHGLDYNHQLARQMKAILEKDAPYLGVVAKDSSQVLDDFLLAIEKTKAGVSVPEMSGRTIVIAITNSAQTQTVLSAQRKALEYFSMLGQPAPSAEDPGHVFVLTEQLFNAASAMLGQEFEESDPVLPLTFQNLSNASVNAQGERIWRARFSEAASAEIAATQATLTEIRMGIIEELLDIAEETGVRPFGLQDAIDKEDVAAFREAQRIAYQQEAPNRIIRGGIHDDDSERTAAERELVAEAKYRARNVTEWLNAEVVFLLYLFVLAPLGFQPFGWTLPFLGSYWSGVLGGVFAVFLVWGSALFVRKFIYKAPILDRLMGPRSELFLDEGYVGVMLERFNRTLFSLSYGFLGVNFWGGDSIKEGLHRFVSGAYRGFVTIHRVGESEDGIFAAKRAKENAMVVKQYVMNKTNGGQAQAHVKVRGSRDRAPFDPQDLSDNPPPLVYLTDHMQAFRDRHMIAEGDAGLSVNAWSWIGELHDLTDGLIAEMSISHHRVALVSGWAERWLVRIFGQRIGVSLARLFGVHQLWRWDSTYPQTRTASTESPRGADFPNVVTAGYRWKQRVQGISARVFRREPKDAPRSPVPADVRSSALPGFVGRIAKSLGYSALASFGSALAAGWALFQYAPDLALTQVLKGREMLGLVLDPATFEMIVQREPAATLALSTAVGITVLTVIVGAKSILFTARQADRFVGWVRAKLKDPLPDPFPTRSPEFKKFKARYPGYAKAALKGDRLKPAAPAIPSPPALAPAPVPAPALAGSTSSSAPASTAAKPAALPVVSAAAPSAAAPGLSVLSGGEKITISGLNDPVTHAALAPVPLAKLGRIYRWMDPVSQVMWVGALKPQTDRTFVVIRGTRSVAEFELTDQDLSAMGLAAGARLASLAPAESAPRIGVLIANTESRKQWLDQWQTWTGRPADEARFVFMIAGPDQTADAARLRGAGAWWVVDAAAGVDSLPDWMRAMETSGNGAAALIQHVVGRMMDAPSAGMWTAEDWNRLADLSERLLPQSGPARLVRSSSGFTAAASAPAAADHEEVLTLLQDVDRRLAEAVLDARRTRVPEDLSLLAAEWADVAVRFRALFEKRLKPVPALSEAGPFRTPFAMTDPSYQRTAQVSDPALFVTDLEVFSKDGGLPYRMRLENLGRVSGNVLTQALLVRDPNLRTREAVLREHPEADVFGDRIIFASVSDAAERIAEAAAAWGLPGVPAVWIASQGAAAEQDSSEQEPSLWTVALDGQAESTIGILETAVRLLTDPDAPQPGLKKIGGRRYVYRWPQAVPMDYRRLVETLRAARTSA